MARRTIALYYWLTPAFWLVDWGFGTSLRVAALDGSPHWKMLYYVFCGLCGLLIWKRPDWTSSVGRSEATINIFLLVLGILLPYYRLIDSLSAGAAVIDQSPFATSRIVGLVLSGLVWTVSFHVHSGTWAQAGALTRSRGRT